MSCRVRRPETHVLKLTEGDTLVVKKHLNSGEQRAISRAWSMPNATGVDVGLQRVLQYLLDWTFQDPDGRPIPIEGKDEATVRAALDAIEPEAYIEVWRAVEAHDAAMTELRAEEKKRRTTTLGETPISGSPSAAAGASSGSASSTLATMTA